jgi:hypothetical protein
VLVVIAGQTRKIGKTSVAEGLIRHFPERNWTAVKITPSGVRELREELRPGPSDTGRYLAAGARRSFWLRVPPGGMKEAMPALEEIMAGAANAMVESGGVLEFLRPDLCLAVVDFGCADWKPSAADWLRKADALVVRDGVPSPPAIPGISPEVIAEKPRFPFHPPDYVSAALCAFVRERFSAGSATRPG